MSVPPEQKSSDPAYAKSFRNSKDAVFYKPNIDSKITTEVSRTADPPVYARRFLPIEAYISFSGPHFTRNVQPSSARRGFQTRPYYCEYVRILYPLLGTLASYNPFLSSHLSRALHTLLPHH